MALIESLKAFYKDNVENVDKLNNADSILEVLRAKYGNYKGSNIEEYFKELVNNGISPGGGGGGGDLDYPTFTCTRSGDDVTVTCDKTYDECLALIKDGPSIDFPTLVADEDGGGDGTYFAVMSPEAKGQRIDVYNYFNSNYIVYANDGTLSYVVG